MLLYRSPVVWTLGIVFVLGLFMIFVTVGWTGLPDSCVLDTPDTCYCEAFDAAKVLAGAPGVRQPVNTWSNLYAILTSLLVAIFVYADRKALGSAPPPNCMRSKSAVPDLYVFAVLFLGLGSMWFHGSLTWWGGVVDGVSMYLFAAFLPFYSIRRMWDSSLFFWLGYSLTVILFSVLHALQIVPSFVISILVVAYLAVEITIWIRSGKVMQGKISTILHWLFAIASILAATFFWWASQTGNFMCHPNSLFQPHGLLWHPLAGIMAVLLYFYWRAAQDRS